MKRKWLAILIFIPLPILLVLMNFLIDPANIFHDSSADVAKALLDGKAAYFGTANSNERELKRVMIEGMPHRVDCVTIGPSLVFGIRSENAGSDSFYNLSVSGADLYDDLATFGMLEAYGCEIDRAIICVDSYCFDRKLANTFTRHEALMPYSDYMTSLIYNEKDEVPSATAAASLATKINQLFSITYFQASFDYFKQYGMAERKSWGIADESYGEAYYCADGSFVYPKGYSENCTEDAVISAAREYDCDYYFTKGECPDDIYFEIFKKLVIYLQDKGVDVDFFLCPLSPALWDICDFEAHPMLPELERMAREFANERGIDVIGSYNPYEVGVTNADFYDARHMKHESLCKISEFAR